MSTVVLTSGYLCDVQHYSKILHYDAVTWEQCCSYHKQTSRNRCRILTADGILDLSIPVANTHNGHCPTRDIQVADEPWQKIHWGAIQAAYNKSPYLLYLADDLDRLYHKPYRFLVDLHQDFHAFVCRWLEIGKPQQLTTDYAKTVENDFRHLADYKHPRPDEHFEAVPYYQLFAEKYGFVPNLSILDLLLNIGLESRIVLRQCYRE
ncbi:MAG: WbqC family protein [Paludibacteraceae bacterium]|nr:WbqC family protein [Paludibacteraceae bacterium]